MPFAIWVPACERMKGWGSPTDSDLHTLRFGIRRFLHARELLLPFIRALLTHILGN